MTDIPGTLIEAVRYFSNLPACHEYMRNIKWPDGTITCPKCGTEKCTEIKSRPGWLTCNKPDCRKQFGFRDGTIFADSPVPLGGWLAAVWLVANKEPVSAVKFAGLIGVTQKTGWRMLRIIREAESVILVDESEKWTAIAGYEGLYEVSTHGRIRSLSRQRRSRSGRTANVGQRLVVTSKLSAPHNHWIVTLSSAGNRKSYPLHAVVLAAFNGPCPSGMQCRHRDGNPDNNQIKNLVWGTPLENAADREKHGRTSRGELNASAQLSDSQVRKIKRRPTGYGTGKSLAREFSVTESVISGIRTGRTWAHIK